MREKVEAAILGVGALCFCASIVWGVGALMAAAVWCLLTAGLLRIQRDERP